MKFRDECGCNYAFEFVCFEKGERVYESQAEKDFEEMLLDAVDLLELEHVKHREAYRISEEQEQFLRGVAAGFCFAMNRRLLSSGHCSASLHMLR